MGGTHTIGIVGLGVISRAYLDTLAGVDGVRIAAVADLDTARADATAAALDGSRAMSTADLVADPQVDTVLNLAIPAAHAEVALAAIRHGKNVFGEKPLAATLADASEVMLAAAREGVSVGCAPDTVLGTGGQTARRAVDDGLTQAKVRVDYRLVVAVIQRVERERHPAHIGGNLLLNDDGDAGPITSHSSLELVSDDALVENGGEGVPDGLLQPVASHAE